MANVGKKITDWIKNGGSVSSTDENKGSGRTDAARATNNYTQKAGGTNRNTGSNKVTAAQATNNYTQKAGGRETQKLQTKTLQQTQEKRAEYFQRNMPGGWIAQTDEKYPQTWEYRYKSYITKLNKYIESGKGDETGDYTAGLNSEYDQLMRGYSRYEKLTGAGHAKQYYDSLLDIADGIRQATDAYQAKQEITSRNDRFGGGGELLLGGDNVNRNLPMGDYAAVKPGQRYSNAYNDWLKTDEGGQYVDYQNWRTNNPQAAFAQDTKADLNQRGSGSVYEDIYQKTGNSAQDKLQALALGRSAEKMQQWGGMGLWQDAAGQAAHAGQMAQSATGTQYGNINLNERAVINWDEDTVRQFQGALSSIGIDGTELMGTQSTVLGAYGSYTDQNGRTEDIAYSPILQTADGGNLLDQETIDKYIKAVVRMAGSVADREALLRIDRQGLDIDGEHISGLIADVGSTAAQTSEAMHYKEAPDEAAYLQGLSSAYYMNDMLQGARNAGHSAYQVYGQEPDFSKMTYQDMIQYYQDYGKANSDIEGYNRRIDADNARAGAVWDNDMLQGVTDTGAGYQWYTTNGTQPDLSKMTYQDMVQYYAGYGKWKSEADAYNARIAQQTAEAAAAGEAAPEGERITVRPAADLVAEKNEQPKVTETFLQDLMKSGLSEQEKSYYESYVLLYPDWQVSLGAEGIDTLMVSVQAQRDVYYQEWMVAASHVYEVNEEGGPDDILAAEQEANAAHERYQLYENGIAQLKKSRVLAERAADLSAYEVYDQLADFGIKAAEGAATWVPTVEELEAADMQGKDLGNVANRLEFYLRNQNYNGGDHSQLTSEAGYILMTGDLNGWGTIRDDERMRYNYLLQVQGKEAAEEYLTLLGVTLSERRRVEQDKEAAAYYDSADWFDKAILQMGTVPASVYGGGMQALGDLFSAMGGNYNPSGWWSDAYHGSQQIRSRTSERIEQAFGDHEFLGKLFSYAYQGTMSGLDSTFGMLTLGQFGMDTTGMTKWQKKLADTFANGYTMTMSVSAASEKAHEMWEAGYSDLAIVIGTAGAGVFEALFEEVSMDKFFESYLQGAVTGTGKERFIQYAKKTMLQGGIEASEEVCTDIANLMWDALCNGAGSDYEARANAYKIENGCSLDEAKEAILREQIATEWWTVWSSFISGAGSGVSGSLTNEMLFREDRMQQGSNVVNMPGGMEQLTAMAGNAGVDQRLVDIANQRAMEAMGTEDVRVQRNAGTAAGKLAQQTQMAVAEKLDQMQEAAMRDAAQAEARRSEELAANSDAIAEAAAAAYMGKDLTQEQVQALEDAGGEQFIRDVMESREFREVSKDIREKTADLMELMANASGNEDNRWTSKNLAAEREAVQQLGSEYGDQEAMTENFRKGQNAQDYAQAWDSVYQMGIAGIGEEFAKKANSARYLTEEQNAAAYEAGRKAGENGQADDGLRQGGEWNDRAYPGGNARTMEAAAAAEQGGTEERYQQAGTGIKAAAEGLRSLREFGIENGTEDRVYQQKTEAEYNTEEKKLADMAAQTGRKLIILTGDALRTTSTVNGNTYNIRARGLVTRDSIIVRGDDATFTSSQIGKHELQHTRLENGEITIADVRTTLNSKYSNAQIDRIVAMYAEAYGDTGMTTQEIFEEIICDAAGQMNAFAQEGFEHVTGEVGVFLRDTAAAARNQTLQGRDVQTAGKDGVKFSREMDQEYTKMAADPAANRQKLQQSVDNAARAAGFTVNVRHGTGRFGFTVLDVNRSDDRMSFFASATRDTAQTYSGQTMRDEIGKNKKYDFLDLWDMDKKEFQEALKSVYPYAREANYEERVSKNPGTMNFAGKFEGIRAEQFGEAKGQVQKIVEAAQKMTDARTVEDLSKGYNEFRDLAGWLQIRYQNAYRDMESVLMEMDKQFCKAFDILNEEMYAIDTGADVAVLSKDAALSQLASDSGKGVYNLYAKMENMFTIDCDGKNWDQIDGAHIGKPGTVATTREISKWAKEQGYSGVVFDNVIDRGPGTTDFSKSDTVYNFFDPQNQIKSADPVTYDNAGNVIPISQRFNTENKDIRYSRENAAIAKQIEPQNVDFQEKTESFYTMDGSQRVTGSLQETLQYSTQFDEKYMQNAIEQNRKNKGDMRIGDDVLMAAANIRADIAETMKRLQEKEGMDLPEDMEGNTFFSDSSYGGSEENTTICPRSLASEAFVDAVAELLGRPLTVAEQIYISQDLQGRTTTPECLYCYVATDRKAYRQFLGEYLKQRDDVIAKMNKGGWDTKSYTAEQIAKMTDAQKQKSLYVDFLAGRKATKNMAKRFDMWVDLAKNGKTMITPSQLAKMSNLMTDVEKTFGAELKEQIKDAMAYAQSASWAKKRVNYVAYNGHILKWDQKRINKLNQHYGLRMYSFSDFHPAFTLENMQMITDASIKGLKMLAYTKDTDFVKIFAPSWININVSVFGIPMGNTVQENNIIGANWDEAKQLREMYSNVGCTFVAIDDRSVEWALAQDWIDVVIPYHLVRTGKEVAEALKYTNYTSESGDGKAADWKAWAEGKDKKKLITSIPPTMHQNSKEAYMQALADNHLTPRFAKWIGNANYMKLVNECRQSAEQTKPVQPIFNGDAAREVMAKLEANGYYNPIGGSVERMYELAHKVAGEISEKNGTQYSREMQTMEDLKKQNAYLRRTVEHWKGQTKLTDMQDLTARHEDVAKIGSLMLENYGSSANKVNVNRKIQEIADMIIQNQDLDYQELKNKARDVAEVILRGTMEADPYQVEVYENLRDYVKGKTFRVHEIQGDGEDFREYQKEVRRNWGIRLSLNTGIEIDEVWEELQQIVGEYNFPNDIMNPNDMIYHLVWKMEQLEPNEYSIYQGQWEQTKESMANDLLDFCISDAVRQAAPTAVDKAARKAAEEGYRAGYTAAETEWEEFTNLRTQAETEEIRQRMYVNEEKLAQKYRMREEQLIQKYEDREAARQERQDEKDARREKKESQRELAREAWIQEMIDRKNAYIDQTIKFGRERERQRILSAKNTELRQKIVRLADRLTTAQRNSGKTDTRHVSPELIGAVREFLQMFNEDQKRGNERAAEDLRKRAEALTKKAEQGVTEEIIAEAAKLGRLSDRNLAAKGKLAAIADEYAKLMDTSVAYEPIVAQKIADLRHLFDKKQVLDEKGRSEAELKEKNENLQEIYEAMRALMYSITESNKAFSMGQAKEIYQMADKWAGEIRQVNFKATGWKDTMTRYMMWQMTPDTFFSFISGHIKGNEGDVIQKGFVNGETKMLGVQYEYYKHFREMSETKDKAVAKELEALMNPIGILDGMRKGHKGWVDIGLKDSAGRKVIMPRGMMLQVYMMLQQEDSRRSLLHNGFRLPNMELYYNGKVSQSYGNMDDDATVSEGLGDSYRDIVEQRKEVMKQLDALDKEAVDFQEKRDELFKELKRLKDQAAPMIAKREQELQKMADTIDKMLTPTERKLIDMAHGWYSKTGQMMREVFLQMYGFEPKMVENYVPIHRDPDSLVTDIREPGDAQKALNLENYGATKERVMSVKPILLTDFFRELSGQRDQMSRYVGFSQVQRDFNKIMNVTDKKGNNIRKLIGDRFGRGGTRFGVSGQDYINHYIADIAGGHSDDGVFNNLYGSYAAATLGLNPRVALSQAASIPTAAAIVGWKACAAGFAKGVWKAGSKTYKNQLAEKNMFFYNRYKGEGSSQELGEIQKKGGVIGRITGSKAGKALFNWCQAVDVLSTGSIMWSMAEARAKELGYKEGAEGYEAAVNEIYTDVIRRSQPNYTTTERSDMLRDKRSGMKMFSMFKTQSNQNLNLLINSSMELNRMKLDLKNNRNGVTKADVQQAGKKCADAFSAVVLGGTGFFVALRTIVNLIMGTVSAYRDDETGEVELDNIIAAMGKEMWSSMVGMTALGGQISDFVMPFFTGDTYYGLSDSAIGALSDLLENLEKTGQEVRENEFSWSLGGKQNRKTLTSIGMAVGLPVGSMYKIADMIELYAESIASGEFHYPAAKITKAQYESQIMKYVLSGDEDKAADALAMLWARGSKATDEENRKDVASTFASWLKKLYMTGDVTDLEAEKLLTFVGRTDPAGDVAKWDMILETGRDNPSPALVVKYNSRGDIPGDVFLEAYDYANDATADKDANGKTISGSKKDKIVKYIDGLQLTKEQKKNLFVLLNVGELKGTPWE